MGLHQDRDESDFSAPVVSVSLGDDCLFRVGGTKRDRPDAIVSPAPAAMSSCSAARGGSPSTASTASMPSTSTLLKNGGRINLTLRRVTA